jgi:hypothetical protein
MRSSTRRKINALRILLELSRSEQIRNVNTLSGLNPGLTSRSRRKLFDEEAGAHQEHERHRDLGGHQTGAQTIAAWATGVAPRAFLQIFSFTITRGLQRGRQAKDQTGNHGKANRKEDHPQVRPNLVKARTIRRTNCDQESRKPDTQQQSQPTAGDGKHQAFGEQLPDDTSAAGSQSGPHRNLFLPRCAPGQQEVRDVRTGNQQHKYNRTKRPAEKPAHHDEDACRLVIWLSSLYWFR